MWEKDKVAGRWTGRRAAGGNSRTKVRNYMGGGGRHSQGSSGETERVATRGDMDEGEGSGAAMEGGCVDDACTAEGVGEEADRGAAPVVPAASAARAAPDAQAQSAATAASQPPTASAAPAASPAAPTANTLITARALPAARAPTAASSPAARALPAADWVPGMPIPGPPVGWKPGMPVPCPVEKNKAARPSASWLSSGSCVQRHSMLALGCPKA